ncbi:MAG TPA: response regulator [Pyrinomonadaceae bacterium]|nr:response regulator [Pyrinomonadaceae bacterium]
MESEPSTTTSDGELSAAASKQRCILLVEDDRSVRRYLEVTLQRAGYEVITAEDGLAGMRCALTSRVDAVITDAVMPQMSGHELARFLRSNPKLSKVPIVLLTGQENRAAAASSENLIDVFLDKPVKAEELKNCLAGLFN